MVDVPADIIDQIEREHGPIAAVLDVTATATRVVMLVRFVRAGRVGYIRCPRLRDAQPDL